MTRTGSTTGRAVAACATTAALLTGCGVQETGVVEAGGPATITVFPASDQRMLLFFLASDGRLTPVTRLSTTDVPPNAKQEWIGKTLAALFAGPSANERAAGLHTGLPAKGAKMVFKSTSSTITIRLPLPVRPLAKTALRQLVCTAAYAEGGDGTAEVTIAGDDGTLPPTLC
ncbi:hypothetical protein [Streptomyces sp. NPDC002088]|uniref:hypothetical protein n=1 Tax=Streptomyces sp. NPDC002088 TaxID=3154665 RepID=UPI00331F92EA